MSDTIPMTKILDNTRVYYLRDRAKAQTVNGVLHRGDPVAVVVTEVDRHRCKIRYAFAMVHPKDHFVKSRARHIAVERLNGIDKADKFKSSRKNGARVIDDLVGGLPTRGHDITRMVMRDIVRSPDVPERLANLASDWLEFAELPKEDISDRLPTIPVPANSPAIARHRDAMLPPPPMSDVASAIKHMPLGDPA